MAQRLRLYDLRNSRFPRVLGLCQDNVSEIADYANSIQETLLYDKAAGDEGWQGSWAEVAFNVSRTSPYITLPREIARLQAITVCDEPVALNNQYFEYLAFGNGRMSADCNCPDQLAAYARNNAITSTDLTSPPQYLRAYLTNAQDAGKRVMFSGTDANDTPIYSQDNLVIVNGIFVSLESPYVTTTLTFNSITGIQKDITAGQVQIYQVDPTTGDEVLLLTMEPGETVASYRRYYFHDLPNSCCVVPGSSASTTIQVTAIAKLEPVPVIVDTDYLILTSREAFIAEAMALRLQEADTAAAQQMAAIHHARAIRLLIGQSSHYQGINAVAVAFEPFGSANLDKIAIGMV